jgi:hypothetical protein
MLVCLIKWFYYFRTHTFAVVIDLFVGVVKFRKIAICRILGISV